MERKVIDVSRYQEGIDWTKVKGNVDGVIIRCGYGSNLENQDDPYFQGNITGCIENGIPFGVYLYSYAKNTEAAVSEAAHVLRLIGPYQDKLSYPVYLDLEERGTEGGAVERAIAFGERIEAAGLWCGIYSNQNWWQNYLKGGLDRFTKWVALYSEERPVGISGTYDMWQYSTQGRIPGISGNVDMNICYRDFPREIRGNVEENQGPAVPEDTGSPAVVPENSGSPTATVTLACDIHRGPGQEYEKLGRVSKGSRVKVWNDHLGWCMVDNEKWINGTFVRKDREDFVSGKGIAIKNKAEIRKGPGADFDVLKNEKGRVVVLKKNTEVKLWAEAAGWYMIDNGKWVRTETIQRASFGK